MNHLIITKRLQLRDVQMDDAEMLYKLWSSLEVTQYINLKPLVSLDQAIEMIRFFQYQYSIQSGIRYSIWHHNSIIGSCGYNRYNPELQVIEIGYELDSHYWRQGFGCEVVDALTYNAFEELNCERVEALIDPENVASQKLLEQLNFIQEAYLANYIRSKDGAFIDILLYTKMRPSNNIE